MVFFKIFPLRKLRFAVLIAAALVICACGMIVTLGSRPADMPDTDTLPDNIPEAGSENIGNGHSSGAQADSEEESSDVSKSTAPVRLCVIMYHGLVKNRARQNQYMIDPHFFEDDLRYLTENGYTTIVTKDLTEHFLYGKPLPEKSVMLTFDDGYYNNYLYACPLLKKYGCRAVLSPIGRACEKAENEERQDEFYSQCTIAQLGEMCESGVFELAYHTYDLHSISSGVQGVQQRPDENDADYRTRLAQDIKSFSECMSQACGDELCCFTYPFGAKSRLTDEIVRSSGFRCALDCEEKVNILDSPEELYSIHRFLRDGKTSSAEFFHKLEVMS
ncbi:MAG: polysaccharide deacetylase family protein [Clostridia bacterium]|nr:polysaccharide deacetylase family protein [Clostridia bacterium]